MHNLVTRCQVTHTRPSFKARICQHHTCQARNFLRITSTARAPLSHTQVKMAILGRIAISRVVRTPGPKPTEAPNTLYERTRGFLRKNKAREGFLKTTNLAASSDVMSLLHSRNAFYGLFVLFLHSRSAHATCSPVLFRTPIRDPMLKVSLMFLAAASL